MKPLLTKLYRGFGSDRFFVVVVGFLVVSSGWIALTGRFPMAFDEDFHLGIIRLYASHGLPFWSGQPAHADAYGAVARDPSYMYHYLMSFLYSFICLFTQNQTIQVLLLRAVNIVLFASSLPIWRRLLRRAGGSTAMINGCLALFVLIPVTPLLAAQINYDNLLIPTIALVLLLTLSLHQRSAAERPRTVLQILLLGIFASLIKFAFLPIFLGILVWLLAQSMPMWRKRHEWWGYTISMTKTRVGMLLLAGLVLFIGLGIERYGINVLRYHDPIPDCGKVLSLQHCQYYGPYIRDYNFASNKTNYHTTPIAFGKEWLYGMWLRSFFAVDGPASLYETRGPFYVPAYTALGLVGLGLFGLITGIRKLWRRQGGSVSLFALVSGIYVIALWLEEYKAYRHTGFPVAINGRYLLPVILLIVFMAASACSRVLNGRLYIKTLILLISLGALSAGGGPLTYILRSSDYWYWQNSAIRISNHGLKHVFGPITPGFNSPLQFLR